MRKFFKLSFAVLAGGPLIYWAIVVTFLGRVPSTKEFFWPSQNSSLNASLAHWDHTLSQYMIVGSSVALKNLSGRDLSDSTQEWEVIGGFGLDPQQSLHLIRELDITNSHIIIPLSILEIIKLNNGAQRSTELNWFRITNIRSFLHLEELRALDKTNYSHIQFDEFGNALIEPSTNGQNVPDNLIGKHFEVDTTGIKAFALQCNNEAASRGNFIHLITTPFCHSLGTLNPENQNNVCSIKFKLSNCTLHQHFCDSTILSHFTDAYHFNSNGAIAFANLIKPQLQQPHQNALQQP